MYEVNLIAASDTGGDSDPRRPCRPLAACRCARSRRILERTTVHRTCDADHCPCDPPLTNHTGFTRWRALPPTGPPPTGPTFDFTTHRSTLARREDLAERASPLQSSPTSTRSTAGPCPLR